MELGTIDPLFGLTARIFLGLFFLAAGLHKARGWRPFVAAIGGYALLPRALLIPAAVALLASELAVAGLLLAPGFAVIASYGAIAVLALYFAAIAINLMRGRRNIDCGCSFGSRASLLSGWHLVRIGGLIALATLPLAGAYAREITAFDMANVAGAVVVLGILYGAIDALLANHGRMIGAA